MEEYKAWLEKAAHDLLNAGHTLKLPDESCPFDTVCFHAHQCVEKCLKAVLVQAGKEFPKTHDLVVLKNLAAECGLKDVSNDAILELNRYAVETRYPGDWEPFDRPGAEQAAQLAEEIKVLVETLLDS